MPPPTQKMPNLTGMYYDPDKKKYFKILPHHLAPQGSSYSKEAIVKQKRSDKATKRQQRARVARRRRTMTRLKGHWPLSNNNASTLMIRELGLRLPSTVDPAPQYHAEDIIARDFNPRIIGVAGDPWSLTGLAQAAYDPQQVISNNGGMQGRQIHVISFVDSPDDTGYNTLEDLTSTARHKGPAGEIRFFNTGRYFNRFTQNEPQTRFSQVPADTVTPALLQVWNGKPIITLNYAHFIIINGRWTHRNFKLVEYSMPHNDDGPDSDSDEAVTHLRAPKCTATSRKQHGLDAQRFAVSYGTHLEVWFSIDGFLRRLSAERAEFYFQSDVLSIDFPSTNSILVGLRTGNILQLIIEGNFITISRSIWVPSAVNFLRHLTQEPDAVIASSFGGAIAKWDLRVKTVQQVHVCRPLVEYVVDARQTAPFGPTVIDLDEPSGLLAVVDADIPADTNTHGDKDTARPERADVVALYSLRTGERITLLDTPDTNSLNLSISGGGDSKKPPALAMPRPPARGGWSVGLPRLRPEGIIGQIKFVRNAHYSSSSSSSSEAGVASLVVAVGSRLVEFTVTKALDNQEWARTVDEDVAAWWRQTACRYG